MSTSQSTIDFLMDQLSSLPLVRVRKMFGDYALSCDEKVVALVCDNRVFVKVTAAGKALVGPLYEEGQAYPRAKPSMMLGADFVDNAERLCELLEITASALPTAAPKAAKRTRATKAAKATIKRAKRM